MRNIELIKLSLRNFKGMTYSFTPNGESVNFYGQNKTGKTTIADAFFYLMTGKNSKGQAKFDIKTNRADGTPETNLEHEVAGVFNVDGIAVELRCVFHEVWKRQRGSVEQKMSGHTTDYFIDGVGVSESAYKSRVTEMIGDEQVFALVSNPTYFIDLTAQKWEQARGLIMKHFSTITDEQVFEAVDELSELRDILIGKKRDAETHKDVVSAEQRKLNEQVSGIPGRIDENKRMMPDISGLMRETLSEDVAGLEHEINARKLSLQGIQTGGNIADLSKRLALVNTEIAAIETSHRSQILGVVSRLDMDLSEIQTAIRSNTTRIQGINIAIIKNKTLSEGIDKALEVARDDWSSVDAETFQDGTAESCAACGQSLPTERVLEAREKALAAFNLSKAHRLTEIEERGQRLAGNKDTLVDETNALQVEREALNATLAEMEPQLQALTAERELALKDSTDFSAREDHQSLVAARTELTAQLQSEKDETAMDVGGVRMEIDALQVKLIDAKGNLDKFRQREDGEKRITELMREEKKLAAEYERLEKEKFLCEKFIQEKARIMSDEINQHFKISRFVLFETQVNGGVRPTCLITEGGNIAGRGLNTGTTINVGLDICQAFSTALGLRTPIVIDNSESVTSWVVTDQQIIRFNARVEDKALRVEAVMPIKSKIAA